MRLFVYSTIVVVFVAGLTLSTPIGEVSGSISATATVSQPLGIVSIPSESNATFRRAPRFGLLSPRADAVLIEINGYPVTLPCAIAGTTVTEITRLPIDGSSLQIISIIYTAN